MRVIAGKYKGRRLASPKWPGLRPTSDKLRETLFNVLAPRVPAARVLDGFAGTGALGIEALSRGAGDVTFVDSDPRAARLITENVSRCGIVEGYAIIRAGLTAASLAPIADRRFDLILLDPPYDVPDIERVLVALSPLLAPGGVLVLEHARRRPAPRTAGSLVCTRELISGDSALAFFRRHDEQ